MGLSSDIAYFAGLFEGEGWVNGKTGTNTWRLGINMTDLEPLQESLRIMGGKINGPYDRTKYGAKKLIYSWTLHGYENVERVYKLIKRFLSPRRIIQFDIALSIKPRKLQPCGTYGGFQRHFRRKEIPCTECSSARNSYQLIWYHQTRKI